MLRRTFFSTQAVLAGVPLLRGNEPAAAAPDVLRAPDAVTVQGARGDVRLSRSGDVWSGAGCDVTATVRGAKHGMEVPIVVHAPGVALHRIGLRWHGGVPANWRVLGDHWERSYGDLEWRGCVPHRVMPWYFLAAAPGGKSVYGCGVKTGCASIAHWQADPAGVTLWLDVRSGGSGVQLGARALEAAVVVAHASAAGQSALDAARSLCRRMCERPRLSPFPPYGGNNWYYTYGRNLTAEALLRDSELMAGLAPNSENRPFMVLDMGYSVAGEGAGPFDKTNAGFPEMGNLAAEMKRRGVRPGIWTRPLLTVESLPETWRLKGKQAAGGLGAPYFVIDPSVPEALAHVETSIKGLHAWGFELIKHDFSTYDLTGLWGFQMTESLAGPGWRFADSSRTTAEIITALYAAIRRGAGEAQLIGCNTVGHLGAGLFEMQRIGDDTSGKEWARTRKMGVNTLAFRLAQHNTLFGADADCVPVTKAIPWELTRQWLDLVARSATALFVSADPTILGDRERTAIRAAFELAAKPQVGAEPLDWFDTTAPSRWRSGGRTIEYRWYEEEI